MANKDIRLGIHHNSIENAILGSFLFINEFCPKNEIIEDFFKLEEDVFTSDFRKKVAMRINKSEKEHLSFLLYKIEQSCVGTELEKEFLDIISQNSMPLALCKLYHDDLLERMKLEAII